ncbi:MAG: peptidoglycan editing factor PgeF [Acidobacteriia bacterium]|nr:peptidoglycan editing factor PgeF [Terriglobia bacterium]
MAVKSKLVPGKSRALPVLRARNLRNLSWLVHGFSTRRGGTTRLYGGDALNLGFTQDDTRINVERNRRRFLVSAGAAQGLRPWPLVALKQVHSDLIHPVVSRKPARLVGDGLVTNIPGVALAVQTADCFPVLLVDRAHHALGVFHAGWRGTVQRIVEKGLGIMRREYGTLPGDVSAVIGPGIQKCCYTVGEELKARFESQFGYARELFHEVFVSDPVREKYPLLFLSARAPGHSDFGPQIHLDLAEANRRQLLAAGVPPEQISLLSHCTSCETKKFFSHRAEKGMTGRMMLVAGIKPKK